MDSIKAARIIGALNRSIGFMEGLAAKEGLESLSLQAAWLEGQVLEPLMEEYAKDE